MHGSKDGTRNFDSADGYAVVWTNTRIDLQQGEVQQALQNEQLRRAERDAARDQRDALEGQKNTLDLEVNSLKADRDKTRLELDSTKQELATVQKENENLACGNNRLKEENTNLQLELTEVQKNYEDLMHKVQRLAANSLESSVAIARRRSSLDPHVLGDAPGGESHDATAPEPPKDGSE